MSILLFREVWRTGVGYCGGGVGGGVFVIEFDFFVGGGEEFWLALYVLSLTMVIHVFKLLQTYSVLIIFLSTNVVNLYFTLMNTYCIDDITFLVRTCYI